MKTILKIDKRKKDSLEAQVIFGLKQYIVSPSLALLNMASNLRSFKISTMLNCVMEPSNVRTIPILKPIVKYNSLNP